MPSKYVKTPGGVFVPGEQYTYESSELFLSMVQMEYQIQRERLSILDAKVGVSLPVIATYFFLIVHDTDIKSLLISTTDAGYFSSREIWKLVALILYFITATTAFIALCEMICAVLTRKYKKIPVEDFNTPKEMSRSKEQFAAIMPTYYLQAIKQNREQNAKKVAEYRWGWTFGVISLLFFFLYTLIDQSMIGGT